MKNFLSRNYFPLFVFVMTQISFSEDAENTESSISLLTRVAEKGAEIDDLFNLDPVDSLFLFKYVWSKIPAEKLSENPKGLMDRAIELNNSMVVKQLAEYKPELVKEAFINAVDSGRFTIATSLLEKGADTSAIPKHYNNKSSRIISNLDANISYTKLRDLSEDKRKEELSALSRIRSEVYSDPKSILLDPSGALNVENISLIVEEGLAQDMNEKIPNDKKAEYNLEVAKLMTSKLSEADYVSDDPHYSSISDEKISSMLEYLLVNKQKIDPSLIDKALSNKDADPDLTLEGFKIKASERVAIIYLMHRLSMEELDIDSVDDLASNASKLFFKLDFTNPTDLALAKYIFRKRYMSSCTVGLVPPNVSEDKQKTQTAVEYLRSLVDSPNYLSKSEVKKTDLVDFINDINKTESRSVSCEATSEDGSKSSKAKDWFH